MRRIGSRGIRIRLFMAFGAVALMTVAASVAAWFSYSNLSDSLSKISKTHVPAMTAAARLAEAGGAVIATAPAMMSVADPREQKAIWEDLTVLLEEMKALTQALQGPLIDDAARNDLRRLTDKLAGNLSALNANVDSRFELREHISVSADRLRWLQADFLDEVEPMIEEARFNIETAMESVEAARDENTKVRETALLRREMQKREALLKINAAGNFAVGLLIRTTNARNEDEISFAGHLLNETADKLQSDLDVLQGLASSISLHQAVDEIIATAKGGKGVLEIRKLELFIVREGRRLLDANRDLVDRLKHVIGDRIVALETATTAAAERSSKSVARGKFLLALIASVSLLIAVLVGWVYVGRNIVGRLTTLGRAMRAIADGDLNTDVPVQGHDEITEMAKALLVFRDTATEVEEANAEAIIDNSMVGLIATDRRGVIEFFNPTAEKLFGYTAENMIGQNLRRLVSKSGKDTIADMIKRAGSDDGQTVTFGETQGVRADGSLFPMDVAVREFRQRRRRRLMITLFDVTERKNAQEILELKVQERTDALRQTQDELVQAGKLAALGQISTGVVHELNQPLAAIRSYAHNGSLLLERGRKDEAAENLQRISSLTERMAETTKHLKAFARRSSLLVETVDLEIVLNNALSLFKTRIQKESVSVDLAMACENARVKGEDIRLEQVFVNLFANALDAMTDKAEKTIEIRVDADEGVIVTRFTDTGCGIAKADLPNVFDPFFTTKEAGSGLGLGLSISKKIVSDFGGTIRVTSKGQKGTKFTLTLPKAD